MPAALVPLYYVESVERAGGRAVIVPPSEEGIDETDPQADDLALYAYLSWLQEQLVEALSSELA